MYGIKNTGQLEEWTQSIFDDARDLPTYRQDKWAIHDYCTSLVGEWITNMKEQGTLPRWYARVDRVFMVEHLEELVEHILDD